MKKFFCGFLLLLALVFAVLWTMQTSFAEDFLTRQLGTPVQLESARLGFGGVTLRGLEMNDPKLKFQATIEKLFINVDYSSLFEQTLVFPLIQADGVSLTTSLPKVALNSLDEASTALAKATSLEKQPSTEEERSVLIKKLQFSRLSVTMNNPIPLLKLPGLSAEIGHLELKDLRSEEALLAQALLTTILKAVQPTKQ